MCSLWGGVGGGLTCMCCSPFVLPSAAACGGLVCAGLMWRLCCSPRHGGAGGVQCDARAVHEVRRGLPPRLLHNTPQQVSGGGGGRGTRGHTQAHGGTRGYSGPHRHTGVHAGTQGHTWVLRGTHRHPRAHRHTRAHAGTQGHTRAHAGTRGHTRVLRGTHGHTRVLRGTHRHTWAHMGTHGAILMVFRYSDSLASCLFCISKLAP